jgi:hypothetical protein
MTGKNSAALNPAMLSKNRAGDETGLPAGAAPTGRRFNHFNIKIISCLALSP